MLRRRRSVIGFALRLLGALAAYVFAAVVVAGERRWNRPPRRAALLLLVLLTGCSATVKSRRVVPVDNRPHVCPPSECVSLVE